MNKNLYYDYIDERLATLAIQIETNGKLNMLHLHILSETFYADMLNILYNLNLKNLNYDKHNSEAIDLLDNDNKVLSQVSAQANKQKIEACLLKSICADYPNYNFKFISISKDASSLRENEYKNKYNLNFDPKNDIIDILSIKKSFLKLDIATQNNFYNFIKNELGYESDIVKIDTNLATIINILSKENLNIDSDSIIDTKKFNIDEKINFNNLTSIKSIFDENKIYYGKLNQKYEEFDRFGANKSLSILKSINSEYVKLRAKGMSGINLFYQIIHNIIDIVCNSKNYKEIPFEELEMCVYIIVVDAFIKCKIFEKPVEVESVITQ